jgi:hypothetical protein
MHLNTAPLRWATFLSGSALGSVSLAAAWENGSTLGSTSLSQTMYGVGFVALVVATWAILPAAEARWQAKHYVSAIVAGIVWLGLTVLVVLNTIGHVAANRSNGVAERAAIASDYERARMNLQNLEIELAVARGSKLFTRSAACGNDTEEASKIFCEAYRALLKRKEEAEKVLGGPKPRPLDAQAETIGWVLGVSPALVAKATPLVQGAAFEIAAVAMFALWASMGGKLPAPASVNETVVEKPQEPARASVEIRAIDVPEAPASPVLAIAGPSQTVSKSHRLGKPETRVRINLDGTFHKGDLARIRKAEQK